MASAFDKLIDWKRKKKSSAVGGGGVAAGKKASKQRVGGTPSVSAGAGSSRVSHGKPVKAIGTKDPCPPDHYWDEELKQCIKIDNDEDDKKKPTYKRTQGGKSYHSGEYEKYTPTREKE